MIFGYADDYLSDEVLVCLSALCTFGAIGFAAVMVFSEAWHWAALALGIVSIVKPFVTQNRLDPLSTGLIKIGAIAGVGLIMFAIISYVTAGSL